MTVALSSTTFTGWYEKTRSVPQPALVRLIRRGAKVTKLLVKENAEN